MLRAWFPWAQVPWAQVPRASTMRAVNPQAPGTPVAPPARLGPYKRPIERPFTRAERERVTLVFGGLSNAHDRLLEAALQGLGYRAERLPLPTRNDFQIGRENCNAGQCNPVFFVAGALINYLTRLRDERGIPTERILSDYVYVTPGSCGPCRFGMYEAEYRLALRKAGFEGFRVVAFDKKAGGDGHDARGAGDGLEMDVQLYRTILNVIFAGDVLNAAFYQIRPYATDPEAVARVLETCLTDCEQTLRQKVYAIRPGGFLRLLWRLTPLKHPEDLAQILAQFREPDYVGMLARCRRRIETELEVEYTRPKPLVKITGEFWAQTTEGDGNFNMFRFLEDEGAEVVLEPVAAWADYMRHNLHWYLEDQRLIAVDTATVEHFRPLPWARAWLRYGLLDGFLRVGGRLMHREYERMRTALGGAGKPLVDQFELQRLGHPYYHARITGGEGYLEVAKNIHAYREGHAHMTLALKPFGCMPSTQSDGAQAAVLAHYPAMNFLPVETAGDGEINAYSRVQMALGEAKTQSRREFQRVLEQGGYALADVHAYVAAHTELRNPLYPLPHPPGVVGRSAQFLHHVATRMDRDPVWATRRQRRPDAPAERP